MCKEINCDCVSNYANTLSFTGTNGIRYTRTFSCNEIDELADNIDVIGPNFGFGKIKYIFKRLFAINGVDRLPEGKY